MYEFHFDFIASSDQKAGDIMEKMTLDYEEGRVARSIPFSIREQNIEKVKSEMVRLKNSLLKIDPTGHTNSPIRDWEHLIINTKTFQI